MALEADALILEDVLPLFGIAAFAGQFKRIDVGEFGNGIFVALGLDRLIEIEVHGAVERAIAECRKLLREALARLWRLVG